MCRDLLEKREMTEQEQIVKSQLDAFNNKDIEGCLKYFSEDLKVIVLPSEQVVANSKDEIRKKLISDLESGQMLTAELKHIDSHGPFVRTVEVKESSGKRSTISFTYYVEDGLIKKMWGAPSSEDM